MIQSNTPPTSQGKSDIVLSTQDSELTSEWQTICDQYSASVKQAVHDIVITNKSLLAGLFYDRMIKNSAASFFLSDDLVKTKLHHTMQIWIEMVFVAAIKHAYEDVVEYQKKIGSVHARIGIPTHLVMEGTRALDQGIFNLLKDIDVNLRADAVAYVAQIISLATGIMCHAYSSQHERNSRTEESYRLFAISQNISTEKERQRAALLDWENQLMFNMTINHAQTHLSKLIHSDFGLWFLHKGSHIFEGTEDVHKIQEYIESIDESLDQLSNNASTDNKPYIDTLLSIREKTKAISYLLNEIFEQESALEAGRDALTNLLNRKYLHVIMNREISFARKNNTGLSILAVDIDHFKNINDTYGHDVGDIVLQNIALLMQNQIRGSDYIFRTGGEEFLLIFPDIHIEQALHLAEKLRNKVQLEEIVINNSIKLHITVSIGVAEHSGHPDYIRLLKSADLALYNAKQTGRNKISRHAISSTTDN